MAQNSIKLRFEPKFCGYIGSLALIGSMRRRLAGRLLSSDQVIIPDRVRFVRARGTLEIFTTIVKTDDDVLMHPDITFTITPTYIGRPPVGQSPAVCPLLNPVSYYPSLCLSLIRLSCQTTGPYKGRRRGRYREDGLRMHPDASALIDGKQMLLSALAYHCYRCNRRRRGVGSLGLMMAAIGTSATTSRSFPCRYSRTGAIKQQKRTKLNVK